MRRKSTFTALIVLLVGAWSGAVWADDAKAWVVHGVPGVDVDVYVNYQDGDGPALSNFMFGMIEGPVALPPGDYQVDIFVAGADPMMEDPAISAGVTLVDDQNVALVAHLTADGQGLTLSQFGIDLRRPKYSKARLGVRHAAAAPSVDVIAEGKLYFKKIRTTINVTNPGGASLDVAALPYEVYLALPGSTDPIFGPANFVLDRRKIYYLYAVGVFPDSFTIIPQVLEPEDDDNEDRWDYWRRYRDREDDNDD